MQAEIISIGDELLIGQTLNTNASWLGNRLNEIGIRVFRNVSIADDRQEILNILNEASSRSQILIITGGLGPTKDDITKTTLCEYFGSGLGMNQEALERITAFFASRGLPMLDMNTKQAEMPDNCTVIQNYRGTACGMWFERDGVVYISMPGVPYEMQGMMDEVVLPELSKRLGEGNIIHRTIQTIGVGESFLADKLKSWEESLVPLGIKLAYLPSPGQVKLRLSSYDGDRDVQESRIAEKIAELYEVAGQFIYGEGNQTLSSIIGKLLRASGMTMSVAESCTGGYFSHLITSEAGSSDFFYGGAVTYSNRLKREILGVPASLIEAFDVVSTEVAEAMASGARAVFATDFGVAITGIAGPTGGTEEIPVGTVCIAVAGPSSTVSGKFKFGKRRENNIEMAALTALNMLRKEILRKKDG